MNGKNAMQSNRPMFATRKRRSVLPIWLMIVWWFTHMIPIVTKLAAYATYEGQMCVSCAPRSWALRGIWASTLRISSVAAIAKTPSAKVSSRAVLMPGESRSPTCRYGFRDPVSDR